MAEDRLAGIHHITAISSDPQRTLDFYTDVIGLRLVKLTVNFDDPGTYHFYFGDNVGSPGTILTFFPWPHVRQGRIGIGQVTAIAFEMPAGSLDYWLARLHDRKVHIGDVEDRFGDEVLRFQDPDGLWLELIRVSSPANRPLAPSGAIPPEYALRGFHSATLSERDSAATAQLLTLMGFTNPVRDCDRSARICYRRNRRSPRRRIDAPAVARTIARRSRAEAATSDAIGRVGFAVRCIQPAALFMFQCCDRIQPRSPIGRPRRTRDINEECNFERQRCSLGIKDERQVPGYEV